MTEPTRDQLMAALRRADAAGDTQAARAIALRIQGASQAAPKQQLLATSATDSRPAPGYSGELPQSKPTENDKRKAWYSGIPIVQQLASAVDAAQHHVLNIPVAAAQGAAHMADWVGDKLSPRDEWDQGPSRTTRNVDAAVRQREADYQRRTGSLGGSYVGAAVGEILPWMTGMGELRAAGLLPKIAGTGVKATAKKGALLAAEGATMGAAQPVLGDGGYGRQKAAQIGIGAVAAPATAGALGGLGKGARYLTPSGRDAIANQRLAKQYGTDQATIDALKQDSGIPGYQHTAEQLLGTPEAVQASRVFRNGSAGVGFARRESENNAALRAEADRLAGDDAAMDAAKAARRDGPGAFWKNNLAMGTEDGRFGRASNFLRDTLSKGRRSAADFDALDSARKILLRAQRGTIDADEAAKQLGSLDITSRAGQKALEQAQGIVSQGMVNTSRTLSYLDKLAGRFNPAVSGTAKEIAGKLREHADARGYVHASVMDDAVQQIQRTLQKHAPNGAVGTEEAAIYGPLKAKITNQIDRAVPGYRANRAAYASASEPINDMAAFRALRDAIDSGGRDAGGNQAVTINHLKALLSKDNKAQYPMSPQARAQAEAMLEALQKRSISSNTIAAPGNSSTTADLGRMAGNLGGRLAALGGATTLGGWPGLGIYLAGEGGAALNRSVNRIAGAKAADGSELAKALEAYRASLSGQKPGMLPYLSQPLLPYQQTP